MLCYPYLMDFNTGILTTAQQQSVLTSYCSSDMQTGRVQANVGNVTLKGTTICQVIKKSTAFCSLFI